MKSFIWLLSLSSVVLLSYLESTCVTGNLLPNMHVVSKTEDRKLKKSSSIDSFETGRSIRIPSKRKLFRNARNNSLRRSKRYYNPLAYQPQQWDRSLNSDDSTKYHSYGHSLQVLPGHTRVNLRIEPEGDFQRLQIEPVAVGHQVLVPPTGPETYNLKHDLKQSRADYHGYNYAEHPIANGGSEVGEAHYNPYYPALVQNKYETSRLSDSAQNSGTVNGYLPNLETNGGYAYEHAVDKTGKPNTNIFRYPHEGYGHAQYAPQQSYAVHNEQQKVETPNGYNLHEFPNHNVIQETQPNLKSLNEGVSRFDTNQDGKQIATPGTVLHFNGYGSIPQHPISETQQNVAAPERGYHSYENYFQKPPVEYAAQPGTAALDSYAYHAFQGPNSDTQGRPILTTSGGYHPYVHYSFQQPNIVHDTRQQVSMPNPYHAYSSPNVERPESNVHPIEGYPPNEHHAFQQPDALHETKQNAPMPDTFHGYGSYAFQEPGAWHKTDAEGFEHANEYPSLTTKSPDTEYQSQGSYDAEQPNFAYENEQSVASPDQGYIYGSYTAVKPDSGVASNSSEASYFAPENETQYYTRVENSDYKTYASVYPTNEINRNTVSTKNTSWTEHTTEGTQTISSTKVSVIEIPESTQSEKTGTTAELIDMDNGEDFIDKPNEAEIGPLFEGSGDSDVRAMHVGNDSSENSSIHSRFLDFFGRTNETCTTPKGEPGHCKSLRQCVLHDVVNNFAMYWQYMCTVRSALVGICCPDNPVIEVTNPDLARATTPMVNDVIQPPDGCGGNSRTRIIGGTVAKPHEWNWMVALLRNNRFFCGGALINNWYVLTAAHCVMSSNIRDIIARLGEHDLDDKMRHQQDIPLAEVKRHAQFTTLTFQNDIALLKLRRPVEFTRFVGTICLPAPGNDYTNVSATVAGWGTVAFGGSPSTLLRQVTVPVWDNEECNDAYALETINESFLCAGSRVKEQDACQGDSGGPLMSLNSQGRWEVIGLVSWGRRCGDPNFPGVYTRVTTYLDWINENMQ